MLASDDFIQSGNSLEFSLASDIIELVIVTTDELFMQTLREAVGGSRRLWHVPSADKVSDMLLAGQVGILVLDAHALTGNVGAFIAMIKRQFPQLVLVVAGERGAESELAALISAGTVYRFIHKPMSPGRAKLFAEAACRKYEEQRRRLPVAAGRGAVATGSSQLAAGLAAAVALALLAAWGAIHRHALQSPQAAATEPGQPQPAAAAGPEPNPVTAGEPLSPLGAADMTDRRGYQPLLDANRSKPVAVKPKPKEPAAADDRLARSLGRVEARIREDRLIEPDYDNARYYLQEALLLDPKGDATLGAKQALAAALLAGARGAADHRDFNYAARLIDAAAGIAAPANVDMARQMLRSAQQPVAPSAPLTADSSTAPPPTTEAALSVAPAPSPQPAPPTVAAAIPGADIMAAKDLTLVKSIAPRYPPRAEQLRTEGWVELDFTVAETGDVTDIAVHAASPPGVFDKAATAALAQWHYRPVVKEARPVAQRSRIRIRFALPG